MNHRIRCVLAFLFYYNEDKNNFLQVLLMLFLLLVSILHLGDSYYNTPTLQHPLGCHCLRRSFN